MFFKGLRPLVYGATWVGLGWVLALKTQPSLGWVKIGLGFNWVGFLIGLDFNWVGFLLDWVLIGLGFYWVRF